jgi:hypothetical protein
MFYFHTNFRLKVFLVIQYRQRRSITCSFFIKDFLTSIKNNQISSTGIFQLKLTTMAAKTCLKPINKPHTAIMKSS